MQHYQVSLLTPSSEEVSSYREYFLDAIFALSPEAACGAAIMRAMEQQQYLGDELTEAVAFSRYPRIAKPRG